VALTGTISVARPSPAFYMDDSHSMTLKLAPPLREVRPGRPAVIAGRPVSLQGKSHVLIVVGHLHEEQRGKRKAREHLRREKLKAAVQGSCAVTQTGSRIGPRRMRLPLDGAQRSELRGSERGESESGLIGRVALGLSAWARMNSRGASAPIPKLNA